jgi:hypothetical protein
MQMKTILFALLLLLMSGCGYNEGVVQAERESFLQFSGHFNQATVLIDNLPPFVLDGDSENTHYKLAPGKHHVIVKRNAKIVVDRTILVGNGMTKEIRIP